MDKIIKDGGIVRDSWQLINDEEDVSPQHAAHTILPVVQWRQWAERMTSASCDMKDTATPGIWINADQELEDIRDIIPQLPLIAVKFPSFSHGVGFSIATVLREHHHFHHELRAFGSIIPDQVPYLRRCGYNSFVLQNTSQLEVALELLLDNSLTYQGSVFSSRTPFKFRYPATKI